MTTPPFLGPYVATNAAFDALALVTYEVSQFTIETTIVMPAAFTRGTEHFPNAGHASDAAGSEAYAVLADGELYVNGGIHVVRLRWVTFAWNIFAWLFSLNVLLRCRPVSSK